MQIDGQVALVTGAGSGLGAATARHLAGRGARVAIVDLDREKARAVAEEVAGLAQPCDVADASAVATCLAAVTDHFGAPPRIVVNCAGLANAARVVGREGQVSVDLFRKVIDVNLIGSYTVMSYAVQAMMDAPELEGGERGVVINTSSIAYQDGQVGQTAYAASKGGIASLTLPAARELARFGIRVMAIAPGLFQTPMMEALPEETVAQITRNITFPGRLGQPKEFAQLVADIAQNAYLNGEVIRLDAATRLPPR